MTKAETGEFLFDDLRQLAANHAQQKIEFEKLIPENISLGLFVVIPLSMFVAADCGWCSLRRLLGYILCGPARVACCLESTS